MPHTKKILVVFTCLVTAAITSSFLLSFFLIVTYEAKSTNSFSISDITAFFYVWIVAALVAIPAAVLVGMPSFFLLQRLQFLNLFSICVIGAILGVLVHLIGVGQLSCWACAATGVTSAFLAWLLLTRSNYSFKADGFAAA